MTEKARILFVDDEKRVLNSMRGLFRRDYDLFLTNEGAEAVRIATENDIDVIVADQRMPGMTGIEVLGQVKVKSPRTVRILLTGYADPGAVEGSINIGEVFRFLSKPCPPKMLRETLRLAITAARTKPGPAAAATPGVQEAPRYSDAATSQPVPQAVPEPAPLPLPVTRPSFASIPERAPEAFYDRDETEPAIPILDESAMESPVEHSSTRWQSVTNVVMSEDASEETQQYPVHSSNMPGIKDVGVVVFTVDSDFASTAIRAVSLDRNTILATTLVKVAHSIEQQNAGVLVTDFTTNSMMLQKIIGALKQHMPELVTIVVSSGRDTTDMINLINYGQVFRYVLKPVEPEQLRADINAAAIRHLYLLNNPESVKRHQVIDTPETGNTSRTLNRFLGRIRKPRPSAVDPTDTLA